MNDLDFYNLLTLEKVGTVLGPPGPKGSGQHNPQVRSPAASAPAQVASGAGSSLSLPSANIGSKQEPKSFNNRVRVNAPAPVKLAEEVPEEIKPKRKPLSTEQVALISALGGGAGSAVSNLMFPRLAKKALNLPAPKRALLAGGMGLGGAGLGLLGVHLLGKFRKSQEEAGA